MSDYNDPAGRRVQVMNVLSWIEVIGHQCTARQSKETSSWMRGAVLTDWTWTEWEELVHVPAAACRAAVAGNGLTIRGQVFPPTIDPRDPVIEVRAESTKADPMPTTATTTRPMTGRMIRTTTYAGLKKVRGAVDPETGIIRWANGVESPYSQGHHYHFVEGTTIWDHEYHVACTYATSHVYVGSALLYRPKSGLTAAPILAITRAQATPIELKLRESNNNMCHPGCSLTQTRGVIVCLLHESRRPIRLSQLEHVAPHGVVDASGRKDFSLLTHYFTETDQLVAGYRSEERRVGKECRSRWSPYH
jgi:hypothetical protein